jgi:hypothetical protein
MRSSCKCRVCDERKGLDGTNTTNDDEKASAESSIAVVEKTKTPDVDIRRDIEKGEPVISGSSADSSTAYDSCSSHNAQRDNTSGSLDCETSNE